MGKTILQQMIDINQTGKRMKYIANEAVDFKVYENVYIGIAENIINRDLKVNKYNVKLFENSLRYFVGYEGEYDLDKGLMLCGNFGIGKSTLFLTMRTFINQIAPYNENSFIISSVEEIIDVSKSIIDSKFVNNITAGNRNPKHLLINEFGHKYDIKKFGSDTNAVIESFLMKRYDLFQNEKKLTHITTNLSKSELIKEYPPVIIDRFVEMFNIIELGGDSFRE